MWFNFANIRNLTDFTPGTSTAINNNADPLAYCFLMKAYIQPPLFVPVNDALFDVVGRDL